MCFAVLVACFLVVEGGQVGGRVPISVDGSVITTALRIVVVTAAG